MHAGIDVIGLTSAEVADRVARGQVNTIPDARPRTVRQIVRANVFTPINLIVAILAALVILAGSPKDALFGGVIIANSVIGIVQELRAKKCSTRSASSTRRRPTCSATAGAASCRSTSWSSTTSSSCAPAPRSSPTARCSTHDNLEIDESLLTGEADPIVKAAGDEVLSGSAVVAGTGRVRITKVGAENYAAKLAEEAERFTLVNSPLRNDVNRIVTWVGYPIIPVGLLLATSQFLRRDQSWQEAIISTVAGLVGMVPEGLVLLTSVAFAVGVVRLAKQRCLVQELPAIEVLARVDVLCADKTGHDHRGQRWRSPRSVELLDGADAAEVEDALAALAELRPRPERHAARRQGPLRRADHATGSRPAGCRSRRRASGARCRSATTAAGCSARPSSCCADEYTGDARRPGRGRGREGPPRARARQGRRRRRRPATRAAARLSSRRRSCCSRTSSRPDAPETLAYFAEQGVTVKVISGDNPVTVGAVARRAGLRGVGPQHRRQDAARRRRPRALADALEENTVFGRVTPHQKRAMVRALQHRGHTVAMTGDGVNDVLALKDADCGVAMASGSEATRGVAQLVLLDSNFSALPSRRRRGPAGHQQHRARRQPVPDQDRRTRWSCRSSPACSPSTTRCGRST